MSAQGRAPLLPTQRQESWGCADAGGYLDIKRWYVGIITPDFVSAEARARCSSYDEDDSTISPVALRLKEATRTIMATSQELDGTSDMPKRGLASRLFSPLQPESIRSCSSALAATALGAGALAIPYAFSLTGLGLGLVTLTFAAMVSALSLQVLMVAARYTNTKSYAAVLELAVGSPVASNLLDLTVLCNGVGAVVCILIFLGDFLPPVFAKLPFLAEGFPIVRALAIIGAAVAVWPLTLLSDISALRYVSVAVPIVLLTTISIVMWDARDLHAQLRASGDRIVWWDFDFGRWLQATVIMVNAFANHQNAIPCVNQLGNASISRIVKATVNGNLIVWSLLAALGTAGYVSWGVATKGDFLLSYPEERAEIWCCRLMLAVIVFLVLPVTLLPTAKSGAQLLLSSVGGSRGEVGQKVHKFSATCLLTICTIVAVKISDVASVIGILGGILASSLMFWFPAVVYRLLLWPTQPKIFRGPVLGMIVLFGVLGWTSVAIKFI